MPAEELGEQVIADVISSLRAIVAGTSYHYTPGAVIRVSQFDERWLEEAGKQVVYMVRDTVGEVQVPPAAAFGNDVRDYSVFVMVAYQHPDIEVPLNASIAAKGTIRNRMVRDVKKKLMEDQTRGGVAERTDIFEVERDFEEPEAWIIAEIPVVVRVHHPWANP
jgi:hypothetical protein